MFRQSDFIKKNLYLCRDRVLFVALRIFDIIIFHKKDNNLNTKI